MERILVLLVMCLLVEDGLNDVCSFNEVHTPTNVYSTNRIDVATSKRTCFAHSTYRRFVAKCPDI